MRKLFGILLGLAVVLAQAPAAAQSPVITILHVNDTHSHLEATGPRTGNLEGTVGGVAKAATLIGTVRATEPNVLLLHAGDSFVGDPSFNVGYGGYEFGVIAGLGFDAMTVGNHEFDLGSDLFTSVVLDPSVGFGVPLLGANMEIPADHPLKAVIQPSLMKNVAGVKVGLFGLTVPGDPLSNPAPLSVSDDIGPIAGAAVAGLRGQGADVVICLSHLGSALDEEIAAGVPGIDVIVGGHDHFLFARPVPVTNPDGKTTLILQAGESWQHVGKLRFKVENGAFKLVDYRMLDADASVPPAGEVEALIAPVKDAVVAQFGDLYGTRLGRAVLPLERTWDPRSARRDTPLGNLIADAFRNVTNSDIAVTVLGLVAERIAEGQVNGLDAFRAVPYGFDPDTGLGLKLVTCDITGADLMTALEISVAQIEYSDAFVVQTSGLTFGFLGKNPPMSRVVPFTVFANRKPLQMAKTYRITVNEAVYALLPTFGVVLSNPAPVPNSHESTVLAGEIARLHAVRYYSEGRILDLSMPNTFSKEVLTGEDESR